MAVLDGTNALTIIERSKRQTPDGKAAPIIDVLAEDNPVLIDAPWVEANGQMQHNTTRSLAKPSGSFRGFNEGVARTAAQTIKIVENLAMLEDYSVVDKSLADMNPNKNEFIDQENVLHVSGLSENWASKLFYGNEDLDPRQYTGFAPRLASLAAKSVVGCGGTGGDLTSIYCVQWDVARGVSMVFPLGHPNMGVTSTFLGEDTVLDGDSLEFQAYRTHFKIYGGLVVRDERAIKRLCNIETTGATNTFDDDKLLGLVNAFPHNKKNLVMYCNDTVLTQMDIMAKDKNNVNYSTRDVFGVDLTHFRGVPVRVCDAILDTESTIT